MATGAGGSAGRVSPSPRNAPMRSRAWCVSQPTHPDLAGRLRRVVVLHVRKDEHWVAARIGERIEQLDDVATPTHAAVQLKLLGGKRMRRAEGKQRA
jgi:hypothetical protein